MKHINVRLYEKSYKIHPYAWLTWSTCCKTIDHRYHRLWCYNKVALGEEARPVSCWQCRVGVTLWVCLWRLPRMAATTWHSERESNMHVRNIGNIEVHRALLKLRSAFGNACRGWQTYDLQKAQIFHSKTYPKVLRISMYIQRLIIMLFSHMLLMRLSYVRDDRRL